jgi:hypothetical protein
MSDGPRAPDFARGGSLFIYRAKTDEVGRRDEMWRESKDQTRPNMLKMHVVESHAVLLQGVVGVNTRLWRVGVTTALWKVQKSLGTASTHNATMR